MRNHSKVSGLSLAEVLVALFVIVVGISGVTASIWWALQNQDAGKNMTEASNHGRVLFEELQARGVLSGSAWPGPGSGLADGPAVRRGLYDAPFNAPTSPGQHILGQTEQIGLSGAAVGSSNNIGSRLDRFSRNINCTRQVPSGGSEAYLSELALVEIRVYWNEKARERSVVVEGLVAHSIN